MNTYTEATALAHHGIAPLDAPESTRADLARESGIISVCLGCGAVQGIDPAPFANAIERERARRVAADVFDEVCCLFADEVRY